MSTKRIREALEHLRDNEAYGPGAETIRTMAEKALAEMEAIEKAARHLVLGSLPNAPEAKQCWETMDAIAKETK